MNTTAIPSTVLNALQTKTPFLWVNNELGQPLPQDAPAFRAIDEAESRFERSRLLLLALFPELSPSQGQIESDLIEVNQFKRLMSRDSDTSTWLLKADCHLPIAGSIKARGGFHEVLTIAEKIAIEHGIVETGADLLPLASDTAKSLFKQYTIAVGSTGNLGLSIGVMASALGFSATVHMSTDAKEWKKTRLRNRGVNVVEHSGDYAAAVHAGREEALSTPRSYFVDDEHSLSLFLGYAAAARYFASQLATMNRVVDESHPLFVYIPCGVGGAPGGITYGLKRIFGENVHCFFAEPTASPCMLVQLAAQTNQAVSVYDIGLDNHTEADGLAVGQASPLVAPLMRSQLSGVFTVEDDKLFQYLYYLKSTENIFVEPSSAAVLHGALLLQQTSAGQSYLKNHHIDVNNATHVFWSTGGTFVPEEELNKFYIKGRQLAGL